MEHAVVEDRSSRRGAIPVIDATAADIVELTNSVYREPKFKKLIWFLPYILWYVNHS